MQPESSTYHLVRGIVLLVISVLFFGWVFIRVLKRSDDPPRLIVKWLVTILILSGMCWVVEPWSDATLEFPDVIAALVGGLCLTAVWRESIASIIAQPFTALYDGGNEEIEPRPYYSIADAKRKKGLYPEAIAEVRKQLAKFPTDLEGQLKLAEIQVENLNDLPGAEVTIHRLCAQSGHPPRNIALALNTLADWHLKYGLDREAAREDLQRIVDLFPDSELSLVAAQRIGHLAGTDALITPHNRQRVHVPEGVKNIGLLQTSKHLQVTATDPAQVAAEYVKHLEEHPQDTEVREKLAILYADHYQRLDLAADQLNQLIEQPNQPAKLVVHWLNQLADLQIRHGAGYDAAWMTLDRIIERYPSLPAANLARNRMDLLKLHLKAHEQKPGIKLGNYDHNIGLKRGRK